MRRTNRPRAIAITRQADAQPAAVLPALGVITLLLLTWTALVL